MWRFTGCEVAMDFFGDNKVRGLITPEYAQVWKAGTKDELDKWQNDYYRKHPEAASYNAAPWEVSVVPSADYENWFYENHPDNMRIIPFEKNFNVYKLNWDGDEYDGGDVDVDLHGQKVEPLISYNTPFIIAHNIIPSDDLPTTYIDGTQQEVVPISEVIDSINATKRALNKWQEELSQREASTQNWKRITQDADPRWSDELRKIQAEQRRIYNIQDALTKRLNALFLIDAGGTPAEITSLGEHIVKGESVHEPDIDLLQDAIKAQKQGNILNGISNGGTDYVGNE